MMIVISVDIVNSDNRHDWHPYLGSHCPHTTSVLSKYPGKALRELPLTSAGFWCSRLSRLQDGGRGRWCLWKSRKRHNRIPDTNGQGFYCDCWYENKITVIKVTSALFWSRRSDLFLGRDCAAGLPLYVCPHGQELLDEKIKLKKIWWIKSISQILCKSLQKQYYWQMVMSINLTNVLSKLTAVKEERKKVHYLFWCWTILNWKWMWALRGWMDLSFLRN